MQNITHSNILKVTFDPSAIRVPKKPSTPFKITISLPSTTTIKLNPTTQRSHPTDGYSFLLTRTFKQQLHIVFYLTSKLLYYQCCIAWSLKFYFKNRFGSSIPQIPTCCHENLMSSRWIISNPLYIDVVKDPLRTIKGKEISYIIRQDKSEPDLSGTGVHTITKKMNDCFILARTTRTSKADTNPPLATTVIGKDPLMSGQPNKGLDTMGPFRPHKIFQPPPTTKTVFCWCY